jgi:phenylacetate-CoA ligase
LVVSVHGGAAATWLRRYHSLAVPALKLADRVVVVSSALSEVFRRYEIEADVLRNIVDLRAFAFRERAKGDPRIVWVRHLEGIYDPLTALRVFQRVREEVPDAAITIVGDGSLRRVIEQYVTEHDIQGVTLTGRLTRDRVAEELNRAEVFLNTSLTDGMPSALLEASACGLPIVSTAVGGIPDMIEDGVNGCLAPTGDDDALAREVIDLIKNGERAHRMGLAARANAERFSWDQCALELQRLYGFLEDIK